MSNVRIVRGILNKSRAQFARELGVTSQTLYNIENGLHRISVELATKLSKIYLNNASEMILLFPERYELKWEFVEKEKKGH